MKKILIVLIFVFAVWFITDHFGTKLSKSPDPELPPKDMAAKVQEFEGQTKVVFSSLNSITAALTMVLNKTGQPTGDAEQSLVLLTRYKDKISGLDAPGELAGVQSKYSNSIYTYIEALEMIKSIVESGRVIDLVKVKQKLDQAQTSKAEGDQALQDLKSKYKAQ